MKFIAIKTDDGTIKGKLAFYCRMLHVSRQGFYKYLSVKDRPWKYQTLADTMLEIHAEDVCNDTYGRVRMFQALTLKRPDGIPIPSERTVYRVMEKIGLSHRPKRNPKGITKADREARKSDDLLKRNFTSEKPLEKCVTDITEIKAKDGKLYVSAIFDCFDSAVLGLAMETTMKATLCQHTVENAFIAYPEIRGAVLHSDRGSQYTSELYRSTLRKNEELPDSTVVEVIVKLVSNPKFAAMMQEKISMKVDTSAIEQEIAAHEKQLRQSYSVKVRLMEEIDSLDPDDKHYIKRKADLDGRLYKMYDKIEDTENQLVAARAKKMAIEAEKLTGDNIYKVLIFFDKLYSVMDDQEKRQLMESLLSEVQIYEERQPNGQWLKSIKFRLPIIENGTDLCLDNGSHVECVLQMTRKSN